MNQSKKNIFADADWGFLLFLTGITYVKLYVKVAAILFYLLYLIYKKYKTAPLTGFSKFYFIMPVIGTIGAALHHSFDADGYIFGYTMAVINWLLAGTAVWFLHVSIINIPRQKLIASIKVFFLLNAVYSLGELGIMIIESGQLVPYWYWEPTEYYGGSTGDHIKGIMSNISVTNATINAIAVVYFIYNKDLKWAALSLLVLLLCTSNLTLILLLSVLVVLFLLVNKAIVRRYVIYALLIIGVVYPFLSLNNIKYVENVYEKEVTEEPTEEKEEKGTKKDFLSEKDNLDFTKELSQKTRYLLDRNSYYKMKRNDTLLISYKDDLKYLQQFGTANSLSNTNLKLEPAILKNIIEKWYGVEYDKSPLSADHSLIKIYTHKQTLYYITRNKTNLAFGAGIGNFSSKQAIKSTGLGLQGDYPVKYIYISNDFLLYQLYSLLYVFSMPISEHSIINMPNSIYNQVAGEYGLAGILCFLFFYLGFILKNFKRLKACKYILPLFLLFLGFEYWFEMLTLTVIFELFILMDIYNTENEPAK